MRKFILFILCNLLLLFIYGQSPNELDSLLKLLPKDKEDTNKVRHLIFISEDLCKTDPQKSLEYALKALIVAEKIKWNRGIASSYFRISYAYDAQGRSPVALQYRLKELEKWKELNDKDCICSSLGTIGISYHNIGNYTKALEYYISALKLAEEIKNKEKIIRNLCNIASVHADQNNLDKAIEYYQKTLKLSDEPKFENYKSIALGNLGNIYSSQGMQNKALDYYFFALKIDEKLGYEVNVAGWYINIAGAYQLQSDSAKEAGNLNQMEEKCNKSLEYFSKALKLSDKLGNDYYKSSILGNMGAIYITKNRFKEAEESIIAAIKISENISAIDEIIAGHQRLSQLYEQMKLPVKALEQYKKYVAVKDSVFNENNKNTISELQIKYETEKKDVANVFLAEQNRIQALKINNNRYFIIGLIVLLLLVLVSGILLFRQNKLKFKHTASQFEQKLLRTQMNPHFIFNSLASIESFIYDQQPKEAGEYLTSFSRLMRLILENSKSEYITLEKEIETLNFYLSLEKLRLNDTLDYSIELSNVIHTDQVYLPPMLAQPFIENAIEHGFRGIDQTGIITITFTLKEKYLEVQITDNGIGIAETQEKELHKTHRSMAMEITQERLKILNKSKRQKMIFSVTDLFNENQENKGTKIIFSIPV
ncbi:MAG: tetratricopeptide repeat protein [Bacteroidia bacterium]|nr:tetratricopeptide repeat protein [Bacteroidia bacterium]